MQKDLKTVEMLFFLHTYNIERPKKAAFYIQSKGLHSGRPLKKPIRNCFAVVSNDPLLFEVVYSLFIAKKFQPILIGSVIPFIRLSEAKKMIETFVPVANKKKLLSLHKVDEFVQVMEEKYKLALNMRQAFALEALKK